MKGQALADLLADYPTFDTVDEKEIELPVYRVEIQPWIIKFDGSSTEKSAEAGVLITSPERTKTTLNFNLDFECTNNQVEYEALIIGLQILQDIGAKKILKRNHPSILEREIQVETLNIDMNLAWD